MTHAEWIQERVADLLRSLGKIERDMEGDALVGMVCITVDLGTYRSAVGTAPPRPVDKEIAVAYWDAVTKNVPIPQIPEDVRRARLEAVHRFEEEMGLASHR